MDQPLSAPDPSLTHYGVKGMRWGVTKSSGSSSAPSKSKPKLPEHPDSEVATKILAKVKGPQGSKAKALSNQELEIVLNRLNLEKRLSDLAPVRDTYGQALIKRLTGNTQKGVENTGQQILNTKISSLIKKAAVVAV